MARCRCAHHFSDECRSCRDPGRCDGGARRARDQRLDRTEIRKVARSRRSRRKTRVAVAASDASIHSGPRLRCPVPDRDRHDGSPDRGGRARMRLGASASSSVAAPRQRTDSPDPCRDLPGPGERSPEPRRTVRSDGRAPGKLRPFAVRHRLRIAGPGRNHSGKGKCDTPFHQVKPQDTAGTGRVPDIRCRRRLSVPTRGGSDRSRIVHHPSRPPPWAPADRPGRGSTGLSPDRSGARVTHVSAWLTRL